MDYNRIELNRFLPLYPVLMNAGRGNFLVKSPIKEIISYRRADIFICLFCCRDNTCVL
jgi:hypothetical protein